MAYTYDLTTDTGKVRLLVPDNDSSNYELEDAEIEYFLDQAGDNARAAAVSACRWLARKYAKLATFKADGLEVQHSKRAEVYAARADELATEVGGSISLITLDKQDGYHDENGDLTDYQSRTVYVRV